MYGQILVKAFFSLFNRHGLDINLNFMHYSLLLYIVQKFFCERDFLFFFMTFFFF